MNHDGLRLKLTPEQYAELPVCPLCRERPGDSDNGACAECVYAWADVPDD